MKPLLSRLQRRLSTTSSSLPWSSQESARGLQDRLALFSRIGLVLVVFLLIASNLVWLVFVRRESNPLACAYRICNLPDYLHVGALVVAWLICRSRRSLGERFLKGLDLALMLAIAAGIGLAVVMADASRPPTPLFGLLGLAIALTARAVVVPSTARFTAIISGLSLLILLLVFCSDRVDLDLVMQGADRTTTVAVLLIWSIMVAAVATIASQVIYGLRRKVSRARQLGQYHLETRLGSGGMGEVYRASHAMLRRPTAIKLMRAEVAGRDGVARFEREVQLTSSLTHPNTIAIYDYGQTPDGVFYYAMELLDGVDLEQLVQRTGPIEPARVIFLLAQVCGSLAEAHALDLIHRDIKPANIFDCRRGGRHDVVKVLDFGLVKNLDEDTDLTLATGIQVMGTPRYMSPESVSDIDHVDARSDIYSLGCVAYYLLTGEPPFDGSTAIEVLGKHLHTRPQPPSERLGRDLPADLEALVMRCLAKNPADRPGRVGELEEALLACRDAGGWSEREARVWWEEKSALLEIPEVCCGKQAALVVPDGEGTLRLDIARPEIEDDWYQEIDVSGRA
ncbi:MAG: serine/threonine protein kinase [Planctomycetes bacterium]|nr:serine/threonine protein kinase [Planctomycetota bacterium]